MHYIAAAWILIQYRFCKYKRIPTYSNYQSDSVKTKMLSCVYNRGIFMKCYFLNIKTVFSEVDTKPVRLA